MTLIILQRDVRLMLAKGSEAIVALGFFAVAVSLFPFAFGGSPQMLSEGAAGIVWVVALFSALLTLETTWHRDHEDGTFDLLMLSGVSTEKIIIEKTITHWICFGLPLVIAGTFAVFIFQTSGGNLSAFMVSILLGSIYMALLGGFGAVLTLGARRPALLMLLLVLPLYIPMLLLGILASDAALASTGAGTYLLLQAALLFAAAPLCIFAASAMLAMHVRSN